MPRKPAEQTVHADEILRAAAAVFRCKGFHSTTMTDIAAEVNLTAGSLYHHFPSKQDLLIAVLDAGLDQITTEVRAVVEAGGSAAARLRQIVRIHILSEINNATIAAAVIFEGRVALDVPELRDHVICKRDALEALYRRVIEEGQAAGDFRAVDAGLVVKTLFGALNWVSVWYRADGPLSGEQIADEMTGLFLAALRA